MLAVTLQIQYIPIMQRNYSEESMSNVNRDSGKGFMGHVYSLLYAFLLLLNSPI